MELSIVSTVYRTGEYLTEFTQRVLEAAQDLGLTSDAVEVLFVNDGCPAGGLEAALTVRKVYPQVRVLDLARNFGHQKAMMTGLKEARGKKIFLIDSDLEEDPAWLVAFNKHIKETGADAVYGVQQTRKGGFFERFSGDIFYRLFNLLAETKIIPNSVTARLMTQEFVNALIQHRESEPFLFALAALTGFNQVSVMVKKGYGSPSSFTLLRKIRLAFNSIISFSSRPLVYIAMLGFLLTAGSTFIVLWLLAKLIFWGTAPAGWTSLIVSIWFVGGAIILCIGIVSLYLAKIFDEVKHRPYSIIKNKYE